MTYIFTTPYVEEGPAGPGPLFSRYRLNRGVSVYRLNGEYYEMRYPIEDEIAGAEVFYLGGHNYEVDEDEKNRLEAAGYTVSTV